MSGKSKPGKRGRASVKTDASNAKGRFLKGNPGGPGRGHKRDRAPARQQGTARTDPASEPIAREELLDRLELAERELELARRELALANGRLARAGRDWSAALHALEKYPDARRAVLEALWPIKEAEHAGQPARAAAGASVARPGGEPAVPADPAVPLPGGKREEPTVYDGARRRPVPTGWGGGIESGRPRQRGVDGIGDRYGDSGPLTSQD